MNIKSKINILFFSFFVVAIFNTTAQTKDVTITKEIDKLANQMFVDINNKDYDSAIEMTHPKVFEIASKEQLKALIKSTFEGNEEFSVEIPKLEPNYKLSEVYGEAKNNLDFVFVVYDMNMKMTFHKQNFTEEDKKEMIKMMSAQDMDVNFLNDNSMNIQMNDRITIYLRDDSTKNKWVMVNYEANSPLFYEIVPTLVLTEAKKFKQNLMLAKKEESDKK